jgi:hypothetical protein
MRLPLTSSDVQTGWYISNALAEIGADFDEDVKDFLTAALTAEGVHFGTVALAAEVPRRFGSKAASFVPVILDALRKVKVSHEGGDRLLHSLIDSLGSIGPGAEKAVPALLSILRDAESRHRTAAATALSRIGAPAKEAVPVILKLMLQTPDHREDGPIGFEANLPGRVTVQEGTIYLQALAHFGSEASSAVPDIIRLIKKRHTLSQSAAIALGEIGTPVETILPVLIELLDDQDHCTAAVKALGTLGTRAKEALPHLRKSLARQKWSYGRSVHVQAIFQIDGDTQAALTALKDYLGKKEKRHETGSIVSAIGRFGPHATSLLPDLLHFSNSRDPQLRETLDYALQAIDPTGKERAKLQR